MKITVNQLRRIIKEEVQKTMNEMGAPRSKKFKKDDVIVLKQDHDQMGAPRSDSFKKGDVIVLNQTHDLTRGISGNDGTSKKPFPKGTRFMVDRVSPDDEPGGVTFDIKQMTDVDPKISRQKKAPGGSLSSGTYWIFPEEEGLFTKA